MKFTAFNGSPAGEKSAAGRMLGVFLAGAARAGAETELYHLGDYSIGQCVQHDDMEKLLRAYQSADVVCLGLASVLVEHDGAAQEFCRPADPAQKSAADRAGRL